MDKLIAKILLLSDLIEGYSLELKIDSEHVFKKRVNEVIKASNRMVKIADNHLGIDSDIFGDDADKLKKQIDILINQL
jgi:hypothetical protein